MVATLPFLNEATTAEIFRKATDAIDGYINKMRPRENFEPGAWLTKLLEELAELRTPRSYPLGESKMGQQFLDAFFNRLEATVLLEENNDGFTEDHIRLSKEAVRVWGGLRSESSTSSQEGRRSSSEEQNGLDGAGWEEAHR